jgi:hypothetical protein
MEWIIKIEHSCYLFNMISKCQPAQVCLITMFRVSPEMPATCTHTDVVDDILALICAGLALFPNQELDFLLRAETGGPMVNTQKLFDPNQKTQQLSKHPPRLGLGMLSTVTQSQSSTKYSVDNTHGQGATADLMRRDSDFGRGGSLDSGVRVSRAPLESESELESDSESLALALGLSRWSVEHACES